jgi:enoyl-CoA hydratase/carnithine racemase
MGQPVLGRIQWQQNGPLATVTVSNPARMNAMTRAMWLQLREVFLDVSARPELRCVLVQGDGAHFCAGGDISQYPDFRFEPSSLMHFHEVEVWGGLQAMLDCPQPLIVLVRGNCMGAGLEIASCCDLRMGAASSVYGAPIARLGFPMAPREAALVQQAVGAATASAMLLAAQTFDAAHMLQCGFLAWNTPDEALQAQADALLARMLGLAPQAARLNKQVLRQGRAAQEPTPDSAYAYAASPEHREGVQAFLEKRRPDF